MKPRAWIVPGLRLPLLCAAAAALALAGGALLPSASGRAVAVAWLACVLAAAAADGFRVPRAADLSLGRSLSSGLRSGRPTTVALALRWSPPAAAGPRDLWWADGPPPSTVPRAPEGHARLRPGETLTVCYEVRPRRRGAVSWRGPRLALASPWGLWRTCVDAALPCECIVYPAGAPLAAGAVGRDAASGAPAAGDGGVEFDGVRPYVGGEDARRMDWRATARRDRPVIRCLRPERGGRLMLVVDAGRWSAQALGPDPEGPTRLDAFCDAALRVAQAALREGDAVGAMLLRSPGAPRTVVPRAGPSTLRDVAALLARAEPGAGDADLRLAVARLAALPSEFVLWFGEAPDPAEAGDLLRCLPRLAGRRTLAFLAVGPEPPPALARGAAADALLAEAWRRFAGQRRAVVRALAGRGLSARDATPGGLGAEALAAYRRWVRSGAVR